MPNFRGRVFFAAPIAALAIFAVWRLSADEHQPVRLAEREVRRDPRQGPATAQPAQKSSPKLIAGNKLPEKGSTSWSSISAAQNLGDIYQAARDSGNPEVGYTALRLFGICKSVPQEAMTMQEASFREDTPERRQALIDTVTAARARLEQFCATGDSDAYAKDVRAGRAIIEGPTAKYVREARPPKAGPLGEWGSLMMSAPQEYPLAFDTWLQNGLPRILPASLITVPGQTQAVRDELYRRLIGDSPADSIRALQLCSASFRCGPVDSLTESQRAEVVALASAIEQKIREQRWSELAPASK